MNDVEIFTKELRKNLRDKIKKFMIEYNNDVMLVYRRVCLDIDNMTLCDFDKNLFRKYCHDYLVKLNDKLGD